MRKDPIVEQIRKTREKHAKRHKYDLAAIYKDLKAKQEQRETKQKIVSFSPVPFFKHTGS